MKLSYAKVLPLFAMMAVLAVPAFADKGDLEGEVIDYPPGALVNCDLTGYKTAEQILQPPVSVPDNNAAFTSIGPIVLAADGTLITDVVLSVNMSSTWIGDIIMDLTYDQDCLAATPNVSTRVLCRPRGTNATANTPCGPGTGVGCASNLITANLYQFTDGIGTAMAEGACPGDAVNLPSACFHNSIGGGGLMSVFNGLPKGGCWTLSLSDRAAGDLITVSRWQVSVLNSPTASIPSSWGSVKTLYR